MPGSALGASTEGISHSSRSNRFCASTILIASEVRLHFVQKCSLVPGFHLIRCSMGSPWNHGSRLSTAPFRIAARRRADATLQSNSMKAVRLTSTWGACITKRYRSCDEKRTRIEIHSGQASSDRNESRGSHHTTDRTILRNTKYGNPNKLQTRSQHIQP
jgi:hypothetical protein